MDVSLRMRAGTKTIAFGTHITLIPVETMRLYPSLDFALVVEPDLTIRDLLDHLEGKNGERSPQIVQMFNKHDPMYKPLPNEDGSVNMHGNKGIAWRKGDEIILNFPRPFIADFDDMPVPMHELLPLQTYRMPLIKDPFMLPPDVAVSVELFDRFADEYPASIRI